jgi:pimeloyl-ACP methyl ester carboxylesterase
VLELAARHPERIARGVLLDPALWVPPQYALENAEATREDRSFASVDEAVDARIADGTIFGAPRELLEEDFRIHLMEREDGRLGLRFCRSAVIGIYGELSVPPPQEPLAVPLLAVRALHANVCPQVLLEAYREIAGGLLETTELDSGHIVMWDALDETATLIEQFLG